MLEAASGAAGRLPTGGWRATAAVHRPDSGGAPRAPAARLAPVMRRPPASPARRLAPVVVSAAALALAGCQITSPVQTDVPYVAADGVPVELEDVHIANLLVVAEEEGGPGTVSGAVLNRTDERQTVTLAVEGGEPVTVEVPRRGEQREPGQPLGTLESVPAAPGGMVQMQVSAGDSGTHVVRVPVLPPEYYYEELKPEKGEQQPTTG